MAEVLLLIGVGLLSVGDLAGNMPRAAEREGGCGCEGGRDGCGARGMKTIDRLRPLS